MKVTTDACLFGGWIAEENKSDKVTTKNVFDIGAGTGLLSLMYAQKISYADIDAIEIDQEAYTQARDNIAASPFSKRINIIHGDVKTFSFRKKYDCIISNPPFYEKEIPSDNETRNIAHHQSGLLFNDSLNIIKHNLSASGVFYLLLPFKRNEEIKKVLFRQNLFVSKIVFVKQSPEHNYFRMMIAGKSTRGSAAETLIEEISIWNDHQQYTNEFKGLLKDYYLYL